MSLWVIIGLMAAITTLAIGWPLVREPDVALPGKEDREVEFGRRQLAELERDRELGLLGPEAARAGRLEIQRRILRATGSRSQPLRVGAAGRAVLLVTLFLLPSTVIAIYVQLGSPQLPDRPLAARPEEPNAEVASTGTERAPPIQSMVGQLAARLAREPDDLEGWLLLGRSQSMLGELRAAADAYRRAVDLSPQDVRALSALAETLIDASSGVVGTEAKGLLSRIAEADPQDPRAPYYLGLAAAQAGDWTAALDRWRATLRLAPHDAPWRAQVEAGVRDVAAKVGVDPAPILAEVAQEPALLPSVPAATVPEGLPPEVAAKAGEVARMAPAEQSAFIRSMVERLAAKLDADGSDVEGWKRLVQARMTLNEPDEAAKVYEKALAFHPDDRALLAGYGKLLTVPPSTDGGLPQVPDRARDLFARLIVTAPDDPVPQYYLGARAYADGNVDEARMHWAKARAALPADSPERSELDRRLEALSAS